MKDVEGCRPVLPIADLMQKQNYKLWHNNKQDLFYRAAETVDAPNFWNIRTLAPTRPVFVSIAGPTELTTQRLENRVQSIQYLLEHGDTDQAFWSVRDLIEEGCDKPALREAFEILASELGYNS